MLLWNRQRKSHSMTPNSARLSVGFSNIGHYIVHLMMLIYPTAVIAIETELGLPYDDLILLSTLGFVLLGVGALPAGLLGDRWSAPWMMVIYFLGTGAAAILTGMADSITGLTVGLALIGLFGSIYHPVGMAWLVRNATRRGFTLGINGIFGSFGTGSAALLTGLVTAWLGWRYAFFIPGAVTLALGLALAILVLRGTVVAPKTDVTPEPSASRSDMMRAFFVLSATMLCTALIYQVTSVALPKIFAVRIFGDGAAENIATVGWLVSAVYLVAGLSQVLGGHLADKLPLKSLYVGTYALQVPLLVIAAFLAGPALVPVIMMATAFNIMSVPVENSLLSRYTPGKWRGTAFGAKFVLAFGASAFGVPLVSAVYGGTGGFYWLFLIIGALAALVVACGMLLPSSRPDSVEDPLLATAAKTAAPGD